MVSVCRLRISIGCVAWIALVACQRSVPDAIGDLRSGDPFVRRLAVAVLGEAPPDRVGEAVAALVRATQHGSDPLREPIREALDVLVARAPQVFVAMLAQGGDFESDFVVPPLEGLGERARPALAAALSEARTAQPFAVARLLGRVGGVEELVAYAQRGSGEALAIATAGLEAGDALAQARIPELIRSRIAGCAPVTQSLVVRWSPIAAWTILEMGSESSGVSERGLVEGLLASVASEDAASVTSAAILAHMGERVIAHALDVVCDARDAGVQRAAAMVLGAHGSGVLAAMLERDIALGWVCLAIEPFRAEAMMMLEAAVENGSPVVAERARGVLGRLR